MWLTEIGPEALAARGSNAPFPTRKDIYIMIY